LLLRVGRRGSIYDPVMKTGRFAADGRWFESNYPLYTLGERQESNLVLQRLKRCPTVEFDHYRGDVFCATVPNSTLITRHNGDILVSGNCCVMSGKAHNLGVWSANDPDSGGVVEATDDEIKQQYSSVCGPNDQGCVITDVLGYMVRTGLQAGGKRYLLDGYAAVDHTNKLLVQTLQAIGGASTVGINLPADWTKSDVWDVTSSAILGGHDVSVLDFSEEGVFVSSWGRIYRVTWRAFLSTRWVREYYYLLSPLWYGPDEMAPSGFDAAGLKRALEVFRRGGIPDYPPPDGPAPGPPAPELQKLYDVDFTAMGGRKQGQWWQSQAKADIPAGRCSLVYPALPDSVSVALPREAP